MPPTSDDLCHFHLLKSCTKGTPGTRLEGRKLIRATSPSAVRIFSCFLLILVHRTERTEWSHSLWTNVLFQMFPLVQWHLLFSGCSCSALPHARGSRAMVHAWGTAGIWRVSVEWPTVCTSLLLTGAEGPLSRSWGCNIAHLGWFPPSLSPCPTK
jgi:hypothetical protein